MYRRLILAAALAGCTLSAPAMLVATPAIAAQDICAAHLPEGMKRPGGYCDLRRNNETLAPSIPGPPGSTAAAAPAPVDPPCGAIDLNTLFRDLPLGARVLTAC